MPFKDRQAQLAYFKRYNEERRRRKSLGLPPPARPTKEEMFWAKVDKDGPNGCWLWTAAKTGPGYGSFRAIGNSHISAHRWSYINTHGSIPDGMTIDHLCRRPSCVNPTHLDVVTLRENVLRGDCPPAVNARRTHCIHGHPLSGDNLYVNPRSGYRACRKCSRIRARRASRRAGLDADRLICNDLDRDGASL